jgi:antitoxin component YwqK of YwqJK toxin-antitoxin module
MKKVLGLGLLCVLVGCSEPHDPTGGGELAITKHEDGKTASRGYVITNAVSDEPIKVGDWVYFYEDGQKEKQGSYLEDQMEGVWTRWDDKGNVTKTETYKNGKLVKEKALPALQEEERLKQERAELNNVLQRRESELSEVAELQIEVGEKTVTRYESGKKWQEYYLLDNGARTGPYTIWGENGNKFMEGAYKNGKRVK